MYNGRNSLVGEVVELGFGGCGVVNTKWCESHCAIGVQRERSGGKKERVSECDRCGACEGVARD